VWHTVSNKGAKSVFDILSGFDEDTSPCWTADYELIKLSVWSDESLSVYKQ